jgi:hypothetical protein
MNQTAIAAMLVATLMTAQCLAAGFTAPSASDIANAANNPATIAALLKGASPEQAAEVVTAVLSAVLGLKLDAKLQSARINAVAGAALKAMPEGQRDAFAESLGKSVGTSPLLRGSAPVVSAIVDGLTAGGGKQAGVFSIAYHKTAGTAAVATGLSDNTPSKKAPPVAKTYRNQ